MAFLLPEAKVAMGFSASRASIWSRTVWQLGVSVAILYRPSFGYLFVDRLIFSCRFPTEAEIIGSTD
jgi:hypothetical protein